VNPFFKFSLLTAALMLAACSALETDKVDYRRTSAAPATRLDVPPDLTQLSKDTRYPIIGGAVSATGATTSQVASTKSPIGTSEIGDVRIERLGNQRWLVIARPADKLWEPIREFWQENGFLLAMERSDLGIMETEWAENRAKIPQDMIRSALGKLLDTLYSTAERDKFRTRLEVDAQGNTEVYISHRGVQEVYTKERTDQTVWQPRPADPELETEFLRRLMVKLGVAPEASKAVVANTAEKKTSSVSTVNGKPVVRIEEGFDRSWRRVGLALDRTGFTVEDRDRKKGVYFVRYVALPTQDAEPGFFKKLFGGDNKTKEAVKFQIMVRAEGDITTVSVLDAAGQPESSDSAQRIVKVLAEEIK
jgi:outer membrane protein assembly factor BamC